MINKELVQLVTIESINRDIASHQDTYKEYVDNVNKYKSIMDADYKLSTKTGKSRVKPRMIQKLHNYTYSMYSEGLLSDYNIVNVSPKNESDAVRALTHQELLNYQLNYEIPFASIIDKASVYFEDFGSYYLKLGWDYYENVSKNEVKYRLPKDVPEEQISLFESKGAVIENNVITMQEDNVEVITDRPTIQLKEPNAIILGTSKDGSNTIESLSFIADQYYTTVGNVKSEFGVDLQESSDIAPIIAKIEDDSYDLDYLFGYSGISGSIEELNSSSVVVAMDYYTKITVGNRLRTIKATIVSNVIVYLDFSPFGDSVGYPYARGISMPSRQNKLYDGLPDTEWLDNDQKIIGAITRGNIDTLSRTANGQVGVAKGFLDTTNKTNRELGLDYEFNPNLLPDQALHTEKFPELSQSSLVMLELFQNSMESMSGKKLFGNGLNSDSYGNVASGIKATLDATTQRTMSSIRRFNTPIIEIVRKLAKLNLEFIQDEKVIRLSDGGFKTLDSNSINGDMDITIDISTPELNDKKANDLSFIAQTLGDSISSESKNILLSEIVKLKGRTDLSKKLLLSANEELQKKEQRASEIHSLEVELLKAKIENEYSKGKENSTDAELNIAKIGTENAKADVLLSTRDQKDLDFVRKKQGVDHNESLEKAKLQHNNNLESEAFKSMLGGVHSKKNNTPQSNKTTDYTDIVGTDLPSESLEASKLN